MHDEMEVLKATVAPTLRALPGADIRSAPAGLEPTGSPPAGWLN